MTTLEPPTVLTRPPPSHSPDLPPSPVPSREQYSAPLAPCTPCQRSPQPNEHSGTIIPDLPCAPRDRIDDEQTLTRKMRPEARESRWRELLKDWRLVMTLENSGSVARDHLASERTFLAYTRTSLTIAWWRRAY